LIFIVLTKKLLFLYQESLPYRLKLKQ